MHFTREQGIAHVAVGQQIMVDADAIRARVDHERFAVFADGRWFDVGLMAASIEAFRQNAVLNGDIVRLLIVLFTMRVPPHALDGKSLVHIPTDRAVVDDDVIGVLDRDGIDVIVVLGPIRPGTHAQVAYDYVTDRIFRIANGHRTIPQTNSVARRALPGDGDERFSDHELVL